MGAQAGDAAVGEDIDAQVGRGGGVRQREAVRGVGLEAGAGQDLGPPGGVVGGVGAAGGVEDVQGGPARGVALEIGRVDLDGPYQGLLGEAVAHPVVALVAAAARLPSVVHLAGAAGADGVQRRGVEAVRGVLGAAAVLQRRHVEDAQGREPAGVGDGLAVYAQPGDAAVGVLPQAQVGEAPGGVDGEAVGGVAADRGAGDEHGPLHVVGEEFGGGRRALDRGALDADGGRVVAAEVGGVDDEAVYDAGHAEPDERPVVVPGGGVRGLGGGAAPAAGLPAVHDLALVAEALGVEARGLGPQQVLAFGEELVVGGDDARAQQPVGEVGQVGEGKRGGAVVGIGVAAAVGGGVAGVAGDAGFRAGAHACCVLSRSRPVGAVGAPPSAILWPRSQVDRTTPCRVRPA